MCGHAGGFLGAVLFCGGCGLLRGGRRAAPVFLANRVRRDDLGPTIGLPVVYELNLFLHQNDSPRENPLASIKT